MNAKELKRCAADPAAFREHLRIPGANGIVRFGHAMADFQRADFAALDPALVALAAGRKPTIGRFWLERTKGASKDSDLAIAVLWLLVFSPRPLSCQVGAADQDQADEMRKALKGILRLNAWIGDYIDVQASCVVNRRTESRCDIIPADVAGSHGARPDVLLVNELSHVGKQEFVENLFDNASKVPNGVAIIATNAGFTDSWQWQWREYARTSKRWYWSAFTEPAPWLDPDEIEEARKRNNPQRYARLWGGQWVSGSGDALSESDIAAALTQAGPMTGSEPGWQFFGGLDLGVKHDHSALAIVGARDGRFRLADVRSWAPPRGGKVNLGRVREEVIAANGQYGLARLMYDPHQAELLAQDVANAGVRVEAVPFTVASLVEMATILLERFHSRTVELYDDAGLLSDLRALRLIDRGTSYKLDWPRTSAGHGDKGVSFVLAMLGAYRYGARAFGGECRADPTGGVLRQMMPTEVWNSSGPGRGYDDENVFGDGDDEPSRGIDWMNVNF